MESLEALGWTDVIPRGASTLDEDGDPTFYDSLRTNQMDVSLKLMRTNVETLERRVDTDMVSH
jgi:hypothetical protein